MTFKPVLLALLTSALATGAALAQAPAAAPAGSTGLCKDGSYTSAATKKGACQGHKGVKDWYASAAAAPAATPAAPAAPATPAPAAAAKPVPAAAPVAAAKPAAPVTTSAPAAGGGPGMVWVNAASKTYHCKGSKYYGKTQQGEYMSEAAAKAAGNHADHGKACSAS
jgi:hypothetical protein